MKISPKIYARALVESAGHDNANIAARFWATLQKNKQYKDLPKIMDLMDKEAAEQENKKLVKIYSKEKLDEKTINDIKNKLSARYVVPEFPLDVIPDRLAAGSGIQEKVIDSKSGSQPVWNDNNIILKNVTGKNITGVIAEMDDKYIDLTVENKIKRLKKVIHGD